MNPSYKIVEKSVLSLLQYGKNCIVSLKKKKKYKEEATKYYLHKKKLDFGDGNIAFINLGNMTNATKAWIWEIHA